MANDIAEVSKDIKKILKQIENRRKNLANINDPLGFKIQAKLNEKEEELLNKKEDAQKKEEKIQDKKKDTAEKEVGLLASTWKHTREKNKKDWEAFKEQSRLYKFGKAFWQSDAVKAIGNVFSRIKGIFTNILGEIGEFFGHIWGTIKDTFGLIKGTVMSFVDTFRGGDKKERREKKQAKDIKEIKEVLKRDEKRDILGRGKGKKKMGLDKLLDFLGLGKLFGGAGFLPLMLGFLKTMLFKWIPWYMIFHAVGTFIKTWIQTGEFAEALKAGLKDFLKIPKLLTDVVLGAVDLMFGTQLRKKFDDAYPEFEKKIDEGVDFLFKDVPRAFARGWQKMKEGDFKGAYEEFQRTLQGSKMAQNQYKEASEEMKIKEEAAEKLVRGKKGYGPNLREQLMKAGYSDEEILDLLAEEGRKTIEANKQRAEANEKLERIANAVEGGTGNQTSLVGMPTPGIGQPITAPDSSGQLKDISNNN